VQAAAKAAQCLRKLLKGKRGAGVAKAIVRSGKRLAHLQQLSLAEWPGLGCRSAMVKLCDALGAGRLPRLTVLDLRGCKARKHGPQAVVDALPGVPLLQQLDVSGAGFGQAGSLRIIQALQRGLLPQLTGLDISGSHVSSEGAVALGAALPLVPQLASLRLDSTKLSADGLMQIAANFPAVPGLQLLDVSDNNLGQGGARVLATAMLLGALPSLSQLYVRKVQLLYYGFKILAAGLASVPTLTVLDASDNFMYGDSLKAIPQFVRNHPALQKLLLSGNFVHPGQAKLEASPALTLLAAELKHIPLLTSLALSTRFWDNSCADTLASALPSLPQLKTLELSGGFNVEPGCFTSVAGALATLTQLETLSLDFLKLGDAGGMQLAVALPSMKRLHCLNLRKNYIGDSGMARIGAVLPSLKHLVQLDITCNASGAIAGASIASAAVLLPAMKIMKPEEESHSGCKADPVDIVLARLPDLLLKSPPEVASLLERTQMDLCELMKLGNVPYGSTFYGCETEPSEFRSALNGDGTDSFDGNGGELAHREYPPWYMRLPRFTKLPARAPANITAASRRKAALSILRALHAWYRRHPLVAAWWAVRNVRMGFKFVSDEAYLDAIDLPGDTITMMGADPEDGGEMEWL
jgi:Ran GTPase-activating protein (RanGAP) involved in mRNA processing and transport